VPAPHLVDPRGPRFAAAVTSAVLAAALLVGDDLRTWLLTGQAVVFALGARGRSPYGEVFRRAVRPRLSPPVALEDARPVAFAQSVGLAFALVALLGVVASLPVVTVTAAAAALAAAFVNAAFGLCLGCEVYLLLRRSPITRYIPATSSPTRTEVSA
jgi:hypothetical protein